MKKINIKFIALNNLCRIEFYFKLKTYIFDTILIKTIETWRFRIFQRWFKKNRNIMLLLKNPHSIGRRLIITWSSYRDSGVIFKSNFKVRKQSIRLEKRKQQLLHCIILIHQISTPMITFKYSHINRIIADVVLYRIYIVYMYLK